MRYIIYGPGAIGGLMAGLLHETGHDIIAVARGLHYERLHRDGMLLIGPDGKQTIPINVVQSADDLSWTSNDAIICAVKSQDTEGVLAACTPTAPPDTPFICAQNGVANEQLALRFFPHVYGMCVFLPAEHLAPGTVTYYSSPIPGVLDIGRAGGGTDSTSYEIATDFSAAGFSCRTTDNVLSWKYAKLLNNLGNAVDAISAEAVQDGTVYRRARDEALQVYAACGIVPVTEEEAHERRSILSPPREIADAPRGGSSTWQSLATHASRTEVDYLNGEIVLLGRQHGISTPINATLQRLVWSMAHTKGIPGSMSLAELNNAIDNAVLRDSLHVR
ncbi:MAG: ketopantoate reductase family protein [Candidatus Dormibacteria bacterium]